MLFLKMKITFVNKHSQKKKTYQKTKQKQKKKKEKDNGSILLANDQLNVRSKI